MVIGFAIDVFLALVPSPAGLGAQLGMAAAGVLLNGIATAAYVGVHLGPGPRDGLMTGLVRRTGRPVYVVRTAIEVAVVAAGWLLGGTLGLVTVAYALLIGPLTGAFLSWLTVRPEE